MISWVFFHLSVCQPLLFSNLIHRLSTEIESIERFCDKTIYFVVELQLTELASIFTKAQHNEFGLGRLKSKGLQVSKKIIEGLNSCVLQTRSLTLFLRRQEKITEYVFLENKQIFIMHATFRILCTICNISHLDFACEAAPCLQKVQTMWPWASAVLRRNQQPSLLFWQIHLLLRRR